VSLPPYRLLPPLAACIPARVQAGLALLCIAVFTLLPISARAHAAMNSAWLLDVRADRVDARLTLPLVELQLALQAEQPQARLGQVLPPRQRLEANEAAELAAYLRRHVQLTDEQGRPWHIDWGPPRLSLPRDARDGRTDIELALQLRPPAKASLRRFRLHSDAISHQIINHRIELVLRSDWDSATFADRPRLIDTLDHGRTGALLDLGEAAPWQGWSAMFRLGLDHIAEGPDHLLFLLALLLPAGLGLGGPPVPGPATAAAGRPRRRWGAPLSLPDSLRRLLAVSLAFTVGHSLTLAATVLWGWRLPSAPVEVLIALSILVSAVHAWRPLMPPRAEPLAAGGFGLVHGLAFGATLGALGLDGLGLLAALAGFNLGVEAMQLLVLLAALPLVLLASRQALYARLRPALAAGAGAMALLWLWQRLPLLISGWT
jgi:hypothetical protein